MFYTWLHIKLYYPTGIALVEYCTRRLQFRFILLVLAIFGGYGLWIINVRRCPHQLPYTMGGRVVDEPDLILDENYDIFKEQEKWLYKHYGVKFKRKYKPGHFSIFQMNKRHGLATQFTKVIDTTHIIYLDDLIDHQITDEEEITATSLENFDELIEEESDESWLGQDGEDEKEEQVYSKRMDPAYCKIRKRYEKFERAYRERCFPGSEDNAEDLQMYLSGLSDFGTISLIEFDGITNVAIRKYSAPAEYTHYAVRFAALYEDHQLSWLNELERLDGEYLQNISPLIITYESAVRSKARTEKNVALYKLVSGEEEPPSKLPDRVVLEKEPFLETACIPFSLANNLFGSMGYWFIIEVLRFGLIFVFGPLYILFRASPLGWGSTLGLGILLWFGLWFGGPFKFSDTEGGIECFKEGDVEAWLDFMYDHAKLELATVGWKCSVKDMEKNRFDRYFKKGAWRTWLWSFTPRSVATWYISQTRRDERLWQVVFKRIARVYGPKWPETCKLSYDGIGTNSLSDLREELDKAKDYTWAEDFQYVTMAVSQYSPFVPRSRKKALKKNINLVVVKRPYYTPYEEDAE